MTSIDYEKTITMNYMIRLKCQLIIESAVQNAEIDYDHFMKEKFNLNKGTYENPYKEVGDWIRRVRVSATS